MFRSFIAAAEKYSGYTITMETDVVGWMFEGLFETQLFNFIQSGEPAQAKQQMNRDFRDFCAQLFPDTVGRTI